MDCFTNVPNEALVISSKSTLLIILSLAFPVVTAAIIGVLSFFTLDKKVEELRSNFFLSCIEGRRLNSIELFRELSLNASAFKTHVSRLAASAPASANLQTRHTISLLKFFALFEIGSKEPQADSQQWYIKTRRYQLTLVDTIKNCLRSFCSVCTEYVPDGVNYGPLSSSDDQQSFQCLYFKKVDTKFARRLDFPMDTLNSLRAHETNADPNEDINVRLRQLRDQLQVPPKNSDNNHRRVRVTVLTNAFNKDRLSVTVSVSPSGQDSSVLHQGVGITIQLPGKVAPFPSEGNRKFVISKVTYVSKDKIAAPDEPPPLHATPPTLRPTYTG